MRASRKWAGGSAQFQIGNLARILRQRTWRTVAGVGVSALSPRSGFGGLLAFPTASPWAAFFRRFAAEKGGGLFHAESAETCGASEYVE